jgi:hypothetical protein
MKKIIIIFILVYNSALAQNQEGGSIYSRYGLGLMNTFSSVRSSGMAGTNLAIFDQSELNNSNPATWSLLKYTNFTAGVSMENISIENSNSSRKFRQFNFNNSILGLPIDKENNIVLGFGLEPSSKVLYSVKENNSVGSVESSALYHGSGGVSEALLGLTVSPLPDLFLGIKTSYLFGNIRRYVKVTYSDENYFSNELTDYLIAKGFTFTGGMIYTGLSKYLKIPSFNLAFTFSPSKNINCIKEISSQYLLYQQSTTFDTTLINEGDLGIPGTFGFGVSAGLNDKIMVGADLLIQNWSNFNLMGEKSDIIKNSWRISLGTEYSADKDAQTGFFNKITYRFGAYYSDLNYKINNTALTEQGISVGFTLPLSRSCLLNTSFTYGSRGTKDNNLILDKFFRAQFSFTIGEIWFVSPEEQ